MEDFVVIGEKDGKAFIEVVVAPAVKMIEPSVMRVDISLTLSPVQDYMGLAPALTTVDPPAEYQRATPWFYTQEGCLSYDSCEEPQRCYKKMWAERPTRYRGPHQHVL